LNGEPYALKGARTVRGGEAQLRFLLHSGHWKCFAYLAVVIDLFFRRVVGWPMQRDVVLQALLVAVWRRKPKGKVLVHSDQGSQFTSMDWASFLRAHNLEHSMNRRGNCHDNAVAESFFNLIKPFWIGEFRPVDHQQSSQMALFVWLQCQTIS